VSAPGGLAEVLLVEDNPADAAYERTILQGDEFSVTVVHRLAEGVAAARERRFSVIVLDMSLPDGGGIAALEAMQAVAGSTPIVILSGDDDQRVATQAVQLGAQDYLLKGHLSDVSLRRALRHAIERADLTERLAGSVEELERQRSSVLALNQLKNDLIAVLAHDIKGPLTSIVGFSELLEEGYLEGDAATDAAKTIRTNANRLATLANDVLALSRVEYGELDIADDRVDLVDLLKKTIDLHAAERTVDFECVLPTAFVRGDAERLTQAFDNLLRNAIKYSPGGEPVSVGLTARGDRFIVTVSDRGIGIPLEEIPKLFARFSRASNAKRAKIVGTGIGLFIVKMILERHSGTVDVTTTLGEGSTFEVSLPSFDASDVASPKRVMILTPDPGSSRFIAYELRSRGFRVREVATFESAVTGDLRPGDVILVDDGAATAAELRAALTHIGDLRLVGLGASPGAGFDRVLAKPFLVTDLVAAVTVPERGGVASV
jgi:signal transduction histidine kinase